MSGPDPKRAEEVFLAVMDLPRESVDAALRERCQGDTALEQMVRELLGFHGEAEGILDRPELLTKDVPFFRRDLAEETLAPKTRIGEYTIERLLGTGGMGSVYIATQGRPRRTVALKVIRRGLATAGLIRRFEHEAEVLGRLQHPGIAQIYEAGAASLVQGEYPQPFIAMELVDGPALNVYARDSVLTTKQKLELVARVCDAVHHAHQRGVIHRDLKPGNILVDKSGQPKILDFGVARAADADLRVVTLQTSIGQLIGTLPYMSPEQVLADPAEVDTRSDVYALGVILYQMLSGKLPLDVGSRPIPEAARVIREETPSRIGSVSRAFRGDIDTIVSKAMDKDKRRRYQSAAEMAEDIRLHLRGLPIVAKQDSTWYVLVKQLRRHRLVTAVAAALLLSLLVFTVYASVQAGRFRTLATSESAAKIKAQEASTLAKSEAERANEQATRLNDQLFASNIERGRLEGLAGNLVQAEDLLWRAYLARPFNIRSRWALWEFYERNPCVWTRTAHASPVVAVSTHSTGAIATASYAGEVALFEPQRGDEVRRWATPLRSISHLSFSPDASSLLVVSRSGAYAWFDLTGPAGEPPPRTDGPALLAANPAIVAAPSKDGQLLATARRTGPLVITRTRDAGEVMRFDVPRPEQVVALQYSPSRRYLAAGWLAGDVRLYDLSDGKLIREWSRDIQQVLSLAFTPDESLLIAGTRNRTIDIYDLRTGELVNTLEPELASTRWLDVSPDGKQLLSSDTGATNVWSLPDGTMQRQFTLHRGGGTAATWTSDGQAILTIGRDGKVRCWEPNSVPGTRSFEGHTSWVFAAAYSPDGREIATVGGEGAVRFWTPEGKPLRSAQLNVYRVRAGIYSPDGTRLFAGGADGKVHVLDATTGAQLSEVEAPARGEITCLTISPDNKFLVVGGFFPKVGFYDLTTLEPKFTLTLPRSGGVVRSVLITSDMSTVYTDGNANEVCIFDLPSRKVTGALRAPEVIRSVAMSESTQTLAAGTDDGRIVLWNTKTGQLEQTLDGHTMGVYAVAFSGTGRVLASGSDDSTVKLWDPSSGTLLVNLAEHRGEVPWVGFGANGHTLMACYRDRVMKSWDLLHYNLNIAGNMEYQAERLKPELDPAVDLTEALRWAAQIRSMVPRR